MLKKTSFLIVIVSMLLGGLATMRPAHAAGLSLYLPAVAFVSLDATISRDQLFSVRNSGADDKLILSQPVADALKAAGVTLSAQLHIVPTPDEVLKTLWADRTLYTLLPFDALTPRYRVLRIDEVHPLDTDLTTYPFAFASDAPNYQPERLTRFLLSGTTAIARFTSDAFEVNGYVWAGSGIRAYTKRADFFHISNEVSFDPTCMSETRPRGPFCSKDSTFELLPYLGVNVVELSGNHNLDFSPAAYLRTLQLYRLNGMTTVAGGENLDAARTPRQFNHHGNRIGMLSCNWAGPYYALATADAPGAAFCDRDWLRVAIPKLKAENDVVIITVQYREYDSFRPTDQQRIDFQELADLGADVVLGTQAHKPQTFGFHPVKRGGEALIHYGLGNLFFDQTYFQKRFIMDQLFIYEGRLLTDDLFTGIIDELGRPRPMDEHDRNYFLSVIFSNGGTDLESYKSTLQ